jgi:hypothetical protein
MKSLLALGLAAGLICAAAPASHAAAPLPLITTLPATPNNDIILAADGCGPGWYRGPYGACHVYGTGPYPGGYYGPGPYVAYNGYYGYTTYNGCPPGYWRGPWGGCRDTPYHGQLPNGTWQ